MVDEADELYGLPDDEFTAARDALAKRLRGEKRREDADAVKALRRPSVAAGAINRAVREHGADDLLAAGEALREAHEALLSGDGDAAAVREATAREREAVRDFARLALGDGASPSTEEKVRATLHAASVDDDVREPLVAGRLEREAEAGADPMALLAGGSGGPKAACAPCRRRQAGRAPAARNRHARSRSSPSGSRRRGRSRPVRRRAAAGEGGRARAGGRRARAHRSGGCRRGGGACPLRARRGRGGGAEGPRGGGGPGGARARGAPRGQGGRGRGRASSHRGPAGGQGRRVAP